jgi:superfamily II DNA or RNA helicase
VAQGSPAKFLRPSDRDILGKLNRMQYLVAAANGFPLVGEEGAAALEAMVATGRGRWGSIHGSVLTQGPMRQGRMVWRITDDGSHSPAFELDEALGAEVIRLAPPWYVVPATGVVGPVQTGYAPRIGDAILSAPRVSVRQATLLRAEMQRRLRSLPVAEPPVVETLQRMEEPPVPGLRVIVGDPWGRSSYGYGRGADGEDRRLRLAHPFFRYGGIEISVNDTRSHPTFGRNGQLVEIVRDDRAERKARVELMRLGFEKLPAYRIYEAGIEHRDDLVLRGDSTQRWLEFLYREVPALRAAGWIIEIADDFPLQAVTADGEFSAEFREGSGIDWFELELGVMIDGERHNLIPDILAAVSRPDFDAAALASANAKDKPVCLRLQDGRILAMPAERLRPILLALHELFAARGNATPEGRLALSWQDAGAVAELEAASTASGIHWRGGERLRELSRLLRETGAIPRAQLPVSFTGVLRHYQERGVDWLQFLRAAGLAGILADDMGLGKTVQALGHLAIEKASGRMDRPALVVAPTSVVSNWHREAQRFAPDLKVLVLHGLDRKSRFGEIAAHDLVITTYPLLARDHATLKAQAWHVIMLDEAQTIKNPDAAKTRLVNEIEARHRICLTGTPLENNLGELWSLFDFLLPGFLGDRKNFQRQWRTPIEKHGDSARRRLLARRVRPFLLRRNKSEVAAELPPKTEMVETIPMDDGQRDLYESIRLAMHSKVRQAIAAKGLARSRIVVLDALLKLRQVCCDPRLVKLAAAAAAKARSAKLDRLMELLLELLSEGRRVLLFSQFTSMLALIEQELQGTDIGYVRLAGDTRDRDTPIRRFQAGEVPLFLISLKAGGLGLNLTAADTVIHYDPWWNPAVEDQATDRAHRLGQQKPIFVHKLVMQSSIEEKMEALKLRKRELATALFDPEAGSTLDLTETEVEELFAPISP